MSPRPRTVAEIGEFAVIGRATASRTQPASTLLGPGDDAAIVSASDGRVAVSADMLVEGRHFRFDWSSPREVGRKALAQNAADIFAMGASPTALVVSIGCPADTPVDVVDAISAGIGEAAEELGAGVVGGDLVQSDQVVVSVTVLGDLGGGEPVLRSGAGIGDVVAVTGGLGRSAAGLALLRAGADYGAAGLDGLVAAHRVPAPPYAAARAASDSATSMTDVSDGLLADLGHLCAASGVSIDVESALLQPGTDIDVAAELLGVDPREWIMTGGEDHAFAATFREESDLPEGWTRIGRVRDGSGVSIDGSPATGGAGWESFSV
ncbi:thiamine-phosphate kinase [Rhodococcus sp. NPDC058521]|uniref:thiamine-phosphate kinase n=1 Tax=Rhodococcus sp. NPDC058521 TaxID=3346536 RepID=UPI003650412A